MRLLIFALLLAPGLALGQAGRVLLLVGEATLVRGAQETRAETGTAVNAGDTLRVGPRSSLQLRMSDESIIALRSNTVFRVDEYEHSGGERDRSVFSLVKGGLRTVTGAIARPRGDALVRTSEPAAQPAVEKKAAPAASESALPEFIRAPLRAITGAVTPRVSDSRHVVRTPTSTLGVRGTHYTVVYCDNDCFEPRRQTVAATELAQTDTSPGLGQPAPNGTYGAVSDNVVGVGNNVDYREFGPAEFFYVPGLNSLIQSLIGPPAFMYDRLDAQERNQGQTSAESTETMARSGLNAESRPSDTPVPPAPEPFIVTEQRNSAGDPVVLGGPGTGGTAFLAAFNPALLGFVDPGAITTEDIGDGIVFVSGVNAPGVISGSATSIIDESGGRSNPLNALWGRWLDGSATHAGGTTNFSSTNQLHYLVAPLTPPDVIAAKTGSFPFSIVGGTTPTNSDGSTGSFSTSLTVNFDARTVTSSAITFTFPLQNWSFSGFSAPIQLSGSGASISATTSGSCGGSSCLGSATLSTRGAFAGTGDHFVGAFSANTISGPAASAQTIKVFACSPTC